MEGTSLSKTQSQPRARREAEQRSVTVDGNCLTFLPHGPDRLRSLISMIDEAQTSIRLLYYIFLADEAGESVKQAIIRAAQRGIAVSLLVDGFGSSGNPDNFFADLIDAGGQFCRFNPSLGRRYLLRNHQKMTLIDAETDRPKVMIGGFNIGSDYFGTDENAWRDVGLIVDGPAAARLREYFDALLGWSHTRNSRMRRLRRIIRDHSEMKGKLQWQLGGPTPRLSAWGRSTCRDLGHSRDVEMIAAYFAPTWGLLRRVARAGRRGRARVITAGRSDNNATIAAARFTYGRLIRWGVEIYEYRPLKLHTKLVILDDVVHIGSSNLDIRSLYLNMELMLRVDDPAFAQLMRTYFEGELAHSQAITPELHKKRATWLNRIRWALSFFLVTSLDYGVTRRLNFNLSGD